MVYGKPLRGNFQGGRASPQSPLCIPLLNSRSISPAGGDFTVFTVRGAVLGGLPSSALEGRVGMAVVAEGQDLVAVFLVVGLASVFKVVLYVVEGA